MSLIAMSKTFATINSTLRGSVRHCTRSATGGSPATNGAVFVPEQYYTTRLGSRHRRRYSFKMIVNNNEQRLQYLYFMLSGIVASALLALVYISLWTTADEEIRERLKAWQTNVTLIKPAVEWNYNNSWQYIGNASYKNQIYSAYFEHRIDILDIKRQETALPLGAFRVFAILPKYFRNTIYCILRYDDFTMTEVQPQEVNRLNDEDNDKAFAIYSMLCPFYVNEQANHARLPNAIAISYSADWLSHMSPTFVLISYPRDMKQISVKSRPLISVCVATALQYEYDNAMRIVEFVEMYRILGAEHFYFYVLNATHEAMQVLNYYDQHDLATILPWHMDAQHTADIPYFGNMAQINDCAYRAMVVDNFRYIAVVNFDEILMPYKHNSLAAYLHKCDEGRTSAFVFRNVFFYKKDSADNFSTPKHTINRLLYTQTKVRRNLDILPAYTRSRYIANPRAIIEAGNHNLWRWAPGYNDVIVHATVGLLHHYRDKCLNCKEILVFDYTARKYGSLIWDKVDETCLNIFPLQKGICPKDKQEFI